MGRPSNRKRRARLQRPGKRERARAKKHRRGISYGIVPDAGTYTLKAGRKKHAEFHNSRRNPFSWRYRRELAYGETCDHVLSAAHPAGEPISKVGTEMLDGQATGKPVRASNSGPLTS